MHAQPLHLPAEVVGAIVAAVPAPDTHTLATLLRVSRMMYALAAPRLYAALCVTDTNLPRLLCGLLDPCGGAGGGGVRNGSPSPSPGGPAERSSSHDPPPSAPAYPSPASDARKRHLLALTTTLTIRSVPDLDLDLDLDLGGDGDGGPSLSVDPGRLCPMDRRTFPAVTSVLVHARVPHHDGLRSRQRRESAAAPTRGPEEHPPRAR